MQDIDKEVGLWIENIPYLWVPGKDWKDCFRFYVFEKNTFVYNYKGHKLIISDILDYIKNGTMTINDYFSILPITDYKKDKTCTIVRNYILVYTFLDLEKTNIGEMYKLIHWSGPFYYSNRRIRIRMNGKDFLKTSSYKIKSITTFRIKDIKGLWYVFGKKYHPLEVEYKGKKYKNLYHLVQETGKDIDKLHKELTKEGYDLEKHTMKEYNKFHHAVRIFSKLKSVKK